MNRKFFCTRHGAFTIVVKTGDITPPVTKCPKCQKDSRIVMSLDEPFRGQGFLEGAKQRDLASGTAQEIDHEKEDHILGSASSGRREK